jgi:phosphoglycolate phosphatase
MIKHIVFDFDGVLADSLDVTMKNINYIQSNGFDKIPIVKSQGDMADFYDVKLADCLRKYGYNKDETKQFFDKHCELMNRDSYMVNIFSEMPQIVSKLTVSYSIVSSSYSDYMSEIMARAPLDTDCFSSIIGREAIGKKAERIISLCDKHRISKQNLIYIGDTASDILTCRDIEVDIIAVGFGFHPVSYLEKFIPKYCVSDFNGLQNLLSKLGCIAA